MKYFCEKVIAPGIVIALGFNDNSTWGVTLPFEYWRKNSRSDIVDHFKETAGNNYPQIPYLEFTNGDEWKFRFGSFPDYIKPVCWLDDFTSLNTFSTFSKAVPATMWLCSRRDGGRYYRELLAGLSMFARGISREFSQEELSAECVGVQELIVHSRAIRQWQTENPNWKNWKTIYGSEHRFHFDLF